MVRRKAEMFEPVSMGHIRGHGCRDAETCSSTAILADAITAQP
jgi:hypothetical protein